MAQAPDTARMKVDVDLLASPAFEGRLTAALGPTRAAQLVADRFRALGLKPLGQEPAPFFPPYVLERRRAAPRWPSGPAASLTARARPSILPDATWKDWTWGR